ncbi:tail fiber domain-containing protein [Spirosoma foliorum]|uniref:Tail fiber domain-containing protein n=1 Tax=Spirosoma foliorum TaxID=2710596 RepID=A0A7G5GQ41_9BACT|nr:tail fiber domain-containing protein [Spirosoma foliorum]QMW00983.1 tail fiber domain-containing protein [Spirosoma foliorum]
MNRIIVALALSGLLLTLATASYAQFGINAPAGVSPTQDLEVYTRNGFLVQQKYVLTSTDPNASVNILSCVSNPAALTAQAGILKDPSGDANYSASVSYTCTQAISVTGVGIELVFEDLDTELTDDYVSITDNTLYEQRFSGNSSPARLIITGGYVTIKFRTDSDANVGRGFRLRWRALNSEIVTSPTPIAFGSAMQFDTKSYSFKAGYNNRASGNASSAFGYNSTASGDYSTAMGNQSIAGGDYSMALGQNNSATSLGAIAIGSANFVAQYAIGLGSQNSVSGLVSAVLGSQNTASGVTAGVLGYKNTASGDNSTALGNNNTTSGAYSAALGNNNTASGAYSTVLGYRMNTNSKTGAFMIGDSDPLGQGVTASGVTDQFVGRFLNGYFLLTCGDRNTGSGSRTGVQIGQGQNSWASISDSTKKERFRPINHTDLLQKINAMRLTTWNYKGQTQIRHYGPMAQDFYAAFGHDGLGQVGCDTLIYSHDFAGVTFAGVQALIRENEALKARLAQQEARLQQAEQDVRQANARLDALEAVLVPRRRVARR